VIAQAILMKARIGEISCPTRYFPEASSINFRRSLVYGLGVIKTTIECTLARCGLLHSPTFNRPTAPLSATPVLRMAPDRRRRYCAGERAHLRLQFRHAPGQVFDLLGFRVGQFAVLQRLGVLVDPPPRAPAPPARECDHVE